MKTAQEKDTSVGSIALLPAGLLLAVCTLQSHLLRKVGSGRAREQVVLRCSEHHGWHPVLQIPMLLCLDLTATQAQGHTSYAKPRGSAQKLLALKRNTLRHSREGENMPTRTSNKANR